jgi:hypothetical protein
MSRGQLLLLLTLVVLSIGGCQHPIKVKPVYFSHEDEMVRKGDFVVLADRRVFAVMAFMNACGYDEEAEKNKQMHPVRLRVRDILKEKAAAHPQQFRKWKKYYDKAALVNFLYLDYSLSLSSDYPFERIRPNSELGYHFTAQRLSGFPAVLNDFWETADLNAVWAEVKPDYIEEIHKYDFAKMKRQLGFVWEYMRMDRRDQFVFVSVPNLLDMYGHAIGAQYEDYWYMVEGPGAVRHCLNVHEYLHSIVNPIVDACYRDHRQKLDGYLRAGSGKPLAATYNETATYTWECLVRALDMRIAVLMADNPQITANREARVKYLTENGLTLVEPFYTLLYEYERNNSNFEQFLPTMLDLLPGYSK